MNTLVADVEKVSSGLFSQNELARLHQGAIPEHIAIIMDGNRRWAREKGMPNLFGHWKGAEVITTIVRAASEIGVKVLTLFSFSTENWTRPKEEIDELMKIFAFYLTNQKQSMIDEGVRLDSIGDLSRIPLSVRETLEDVKTATAACSKINLVLAINYGGRDDIRRAFIHMLEDADRSKISKTDVTENLIAQYLDTAKWKDPDLFIRTSGELRLSNFLLWQLSYTEVYITKTVWPEFNEKNFLEAIYEYQSRERRWGGP